MAIGWCIPDNEYSELQQQPHLPAPTMLEKTLRRTRMTRLIALLAAALVSVALLAPTAFAGGVGSPDLPGVYFEPSGSFFLRDSLDTGTPSRTNFIAPTSGYVPITGDWDGDGVDGIGIFSVATGAFFLVDDPADSPSVALPADYSLFITTTGAGWIPIAGNWDGVGGDGVGLFNTTTGTMFLVDDVTGGAGAATPADYSLFMVVDGTDWIPITGDWDGDGTDGVGIYNRTTGTMFLADDATLGAGAATAADYTIFMNPNGADYLPVTGSWDGMVGDGVGIWQISSGAFFLAYDATQGASAAAPANISFFLDGSVSPLGGAGFAPIAGDWDGLGGGGN
jgi:hypothetical protein